ncbi:tetratricopeptide repeat protein [Polyangium aurulentum]|uniref:phosphorylase family protein n=1 Tax=Polyangium aurulentum TaxID=2567896 RepID=UPI0010AE6D67|nr:tetratricopeptide repeat protein [Polyangium aurulentum]UQA57153.1 tetratricopeptide repeat protein [Polyangium aurulentum]
MAALTAGLAALTAALAALTAALAALTAGLAALTAGVGGQRRRQAGQRRRQAGQRRRQAGQRRRQAGQRRRQAGQRRRQAGQRRRQAAQRRRQAAQRRRQAAQRRRQAAQRRRQAAQRRRQAAQRRRQAGQRRRQAGQRRRQAGQRRRQAGQRRRQAGQRRRLAGPRRRQAGPRRRRVGPRRRQAGPTTNRVLLTWYAGGAGVRSRVVSVQVSIARLPSTNRELFGREAELAWLDACWEERVHVASIVTLGGAGKTALVATWRNRLRDEGWRGAERVFEWSFYSQGASDDRGSSADEFVSAALQWFGDPEPKAGSSWDKGNRLAELVKGQRLLLILDGLEPLQWGPGPHEGVIRDPALQALVRGLAGANAGLCVITTRLAVADLAGLSGEKVRERRLERLSPEAGAKLLKKRGVKGTDAELHEAVEEYKGHCLALTLLGSYLEEVADGDIRLRREIGPLEEDERQGEHARRVMAAYERWLGKAEVAILQLIGLFDRPADEDEIAVLRAEPVEPGLTDALVGLRKRDWNKAVAKLRRVGLLISEQENEPERRLDAHPLVREHFGEQLRQKQPVAWRKGHWRLYEHLKRKVKERPDTIEEMAPLYAAFLHGCLAGHHQEAYDDVYVRRIQREQESYNWGRLGAFSIEVAVLAAFFAPPWDQIVDGLTDKAKARIRNAAGFTLRALGRLQDAEPLMREVLDKDIEREDWTDAARDAGNLSDLVRARGDLKKALALAKHSVELADRSGDASQRLTKRATLGAVLCQLGRRAEAVEQIREYERLKGELQRDPSSPLSLESFRICDVLIEDGRLEEARAYAVRSLAESKRNQRPIAIGLDHLSLGWIELLGGNLERAADHLKEAVENMRRANRLDYLPLGLLGSAALHIQTRSFKSAGRDLDETLTLATRCGFRLYEADAHLGYARLSLAEGKPTAAREHLAKARAIVEQTGYHRRDGELASLQSELDKLPPEPEPIPPPKSPPATPTPAPTPPHTMPSDLPSPQRPVDIGIVVALQEEFRELWATCGPYKAHKDDVLTSYRFERGPYSVVAAFVGEMGESQATRVTERMISLWQPASIVVVGIAAGVHDDLRLGDVYVPPQAVQYMQDAKASPKKDDPSAFTLVPGAPAYRADHALLDAVRNLEFEHPEIHRRFRAECAKDLETLVRDASMRERLFAEDLVRREPTLLADGHVATGPVVGAAAAFSAWIRTHDRNVKALEMESAAVLLAAQTRGTPKRALAIRGISDHGDDRKKALDEIGGGSLRKYAMRNAVRLLWALLDAKALPNPR